MAFRQIASSAGSIDRRSRRGAGKMPRRTRRKHVGDAAGRKRPMPHQQAVERRPQAVDVAGRPDAVQVA